MNYDELRELAGPACVRLDDIGRWAGVHGDTVIAIAETATAARMEAETVLREGNADLTTLRVELITPA